MKKNKTRLTTKHSVYHKKNYNNKAYETFVHTTVGSTNTKENCTLRTIL